MNIGSKPHSIFPRQISHPGIAPRQFGNRAVSISIKHFEAMASNEVKPFFISIVAVKPPFRLEEDGVYLGRVKVLDRFIPVK